ncbi:hypothetical protein BH11BAC5_BH11BAC5_14380 [soil metagenome]
MGSNDNALNIVRLNASGTLDSSFGINGVQSAVFTGSGTASAVAIQTDGKIVVAGTASPGAPVFALARYNSDGSPDLGFNGTGQAEADFPYKKPPPKNSSDSVIASTAFGTTVLIQTDGKIVIGGRAESGTGEIFAIARFNNSGSFDSTFGNNGKQTTQIIASAGVKANSLIEQTDQKIVLAGYTTLLDGQNALAIIRYNKNGVPDNTFNATGIQTVPLATTTSAIYAGMVGNAVAIQSTGKIIVSGYTLNGSSSDFATTRINTDGTLDNSFGVNGISITDIASTDDYAGPVIIDNSDRIVVAGYAVNPAISASVNFALVRYNSNGLIDSSFATGGKLDAGLDQGNTRFYRIAVQTDGKLVAAGSTWNGTNYDFALVRYNNDGSIDKTFGKNGNQILDFGATEEVNGLAIQADGKIIAAGSSYTNSGGIFCVARYKTNGTLDSTYSEDGKSTIGIGTADILSNIALQADGKLVLAGMTYTDINYDSTSFSVARLTTEGILDSTFNNTGKQLTSFDRASNGSSVVIQGNGKIVVTGWAVISGKDNFALARYNANGSLDSSFSHDGKQTSVFGGDDYFGTSMAIQNDGKIILAGYGETLDGARNYAVLARYNSNGDLDNSFGNAGNTFFFGQSDYSGAVAINNTGTIALAGNNPTIVFFKPNGTPDSAYGNSGILTSSVGVGGGSWKTLLFSEDKMYAAGYASFPGTLGVVGRFVTTGAGPLPVQLTAFKATVLINKTVLLQWQTVNEENLSGFAVERSMDGNTFSPIGFVAATGNSGVKLNYSTIDQTPFTGVNYYRLKLKDIDGKFSYSTVETVYFTGYGFSLRTSPNPAKNILLVQATGSNESAMLIITDLNGKTIQEKKISLNGTTNTQLNISGFAAGIYNLQLLKKSGVETKRFIKE